MRPFSPKTFICCSFASSYKLSSCSCISWHCFFWSWWHTHDGARQEVLKLVLYLSIVSLLQQSMFSVLCCIWTHIQCLGSFQVLRKILKRQILRKTSRLFQLQMSPASSLWTDHLISVIFQSAMTFTLLRLLNLFMYQHHKNLINKKKIHVAKSVKVGCLI